MHENECEREGGCVRHDHYYYHHTSPIIFSPYIMRIFITCSNNTFLLFFLLYSLAWSVPTDMPFLFLVAVSNSSTKKKERNEYKL